MAGMPIRRARRARRRKQKQKQNPSWAMLTMQLQTEMAAEAARQRREGRSFSAPAWMQAAVDALMAHDERAWNRAIARKGR